MRNKSRICAALLCLLLCMLVLASCKDEHTHEFASTWTTDAAGHWHAATCDHTSEKSGYAAHTWDGGAVTVDPTETTDGVKTFTCTVCGYQRTESVSALGHMHTFASTLSYDTGGHYYAATCGHDVKGDYQTHSTTPAVTPPTCTEGGFTTHTCGCGYHFTDTPTAALDHSYGNPTPNGDGTHTLVCIHDAAHTSRADCVHESAVTAPTCTADGYTAHTCLCGDTYRDNVVPATGHRFAQTLTKDDGYHWYASICGCTEERKDYAAHSYQTTVVSASCEADGYTEHVCACGYSYHTDITPATGHTTNNFAESGEAEPFDPTLCAYTLTYTGTCSVCTSPTTKIETVERHTFFERVTTPATCKAAGMKSTFCAAEDCRYHTTPQSSVQYTDTAAHVWEKVDPVPATTEILYDCAHCDATKHESTTGSAAMSGTSEVTLPDATIGFDENIKNKFNDQNATVSAGKLNTDQRQQAIEDAKLSDEQRKKLGDGDIYAFTVKTNEVVNMLGGTATIRIPYKLDEGEDPSCIIVWYISEGALTAHQATYAEDKSGNGYVTFQTTHFSYYTVTKLTPAQRCSLYGHNILSTVAPTCDEDGYAICARCGEVTTSAELTARGHNLTTEILTDATCDSNGLMHISCSDCDYAYDAAIAAKGHLHVLSDSVAASCRTPGYLTYACSRCDDSYTVSVAALPHTVTTVIVAPTCAAGGYTEQTCTVCGTLTRTNETAPTGHTAGEMYRDSEQHYHLCTTCGVKLNVQDHIPGPAPTELSEQRCTVCSYTIAPPVAHTHVLTAVDAVAPNCTTGGHIAYYVCGCGTWFEDAAGTLAIADHASVLVPATGHTHVHLPAVAPTCTEGGFTDGVYCSVCDTVLRGHIEIDPYNHTYRPISVAPTCEAEGSIRYFCDICGDEDETAAVTVPVTGHNYFVTTVAPTCDKAGYTTRTCRNCNDTKTVGTAAALGHSFDVAYTATQSGHYHLCTRCGESTNTEAHMPNRTEPTYTHSVSCLLCNYVITPALSHTHAPKQSISAVEPSCTAAGNIAYYICACDEWFSDAACTQVIYNRFSVKLQPLGHTPAFVGATSPTCEAHGYTSGVQCERCRMWLSGHEEKPLASHAYGPWISNENGTHTHTCAANAAHTETVACDCGVLSVVAPTCGAGGYTLYGCSVCSYTYKAELLPALGHDYAYTAGEGDKHTGVCQNDPTHTVTESHKLTSAVTAPTCTESGYTTYTCTLCGHTYTSDTTAPTGHDYRPSVVPPTCTEGGYTVYACQGCSDSYTADATPATGHSYSVPGYNSQGHYNACSACGDKGSVAAHTYTESVTAPTCLERGYTTYTCGCGYSYVGNYTDLGGHSYDATVTAPACEAQGYTTYVCSVCDDTYKADYVAALGHDYVYTAGNDDTHSAVCRRDSSHTLTQSCDYKATVTAPTCTEAGYTTYACKACGYTYTDDDVDATGHSFGADYDASAHYEICSVCSTKQNIVAHTLTDVTTPPTCTEAGYTTYSCDCGYTHVGNYTELGGHSYDATVTAPTCEAQGYTTYVCSVCFDTYKADYVAALGHDYVYTAGNDDTHSYVCRNDAAHNGVGDCQYKDSVTPPTCTEGGYTTYTCTFCAHSYTAGATEPKGHSHVGTVTAPTCTEVGYTTYVCSDCADTYTADEVAATGHSHSVPGYNKQGHYNACSACGDTGTVTAHTYTESVTAPTCTEVGYTTYACDCGYTYVGNYTELGGHEYAATVTAPTCEADGYTTYVCSVCADTYKADYVAALGHDYVYTSEDGSKHSYVCRNDAAHNGVGDCQYKDTITLPTCTKGGFTTHTCAFCDDSYTDSETLPDGHNYVGAVTEPTCTEAGYTTYTCSVCDDTYTDDFTDAVGHSFKPGYDAKTHYEICGACSVRQNESAHKPNGATTLPTCTEGGFTVYTCECGYTYTGDITPPAGHDYKESVTLPTCTESGFTVYTCHCGDSYTSDFTEATGHRYEDGVCHCGNKQIAYTTVQESVATDGAVMRITYALYVDGSASITPDGATAIEATWTKQDDIIRVYLSSPADVLYVSLRIGEDGMLFRYLCENDAHTLQTITVDSTCTAGGFLRVFCTLCGHETEYEAYEPVSHDFGEAWHTNENGHYHVCFTCGSEGELFSHVDNDFDSQCDDCGFTLKDDGVAYAYDTEVEGMSLSYRFYHDGSCTITVGGETALQGYWLQDGSLLKMYMDASFTEFLGAFVIQKDGTIAPFVCPDDEHNWILVEHQEQTCGQSGFSRYQCTICGGGYADSAPATGKHVNNGNGVCGVCGTFLGDEGGCKHHISSDSMNFDQVMHWYVCPDCGEALEHEPHRDQDMDGTCDVCPYKEETDIEAYRLEMQMRLNSEFADLEKRYGDLSQYREAFHEYYENISKAESVQEINIFYRKFLTLVEDIQNSFGGPQDFENHREAVLSSMREAFNKLVQEFDVSRWKDKYESYTENVRKAGSIEEIDAIHEAFREMLREIEQSGGKEDFLYNVTTSAESFGIIVGSSVEALLEMLSKESVILHFSQSGDISLPITADMVDLDIDLDRVGNYTVRIHYNYKNGNASASGDLWVDVRVLPVDIDKGVTYTMKDLSPTDWTEATLYESGYIELRGYFYPVYSYGDLEGVYYFCEGDTPLIMVFDDTDYSMSFYRPSKEDAVEYTLNDDGQMLVYTVYKETYNGGYVTILTVSMTMDDGFAMTLWLTTVVTFSEDGTVMYCPLFGELLVDENGTLSPKPCEHEFATEKKEPSCTDFGYFREWCKLCGMVQAEQTFPPRGHSAPDASGCCSLCGEYMGAPETVFVTGVEFEGNRQFAVSVATVVEKFLQDNLIGKRLIIYYSNGTEGYMEITRDMLFVHDVDDTKAPFPSIGEFRVSINYQTQNMGGDISITVTATPDMENATLLASYTLSYEMGMTIRFSLYDNEFAMIEMMMGGMVGSSTYGNYTLNGSTLCVDMEGVEMYLTVSEDGTAVNYTPENTTVIGTYTRNENAIYTVYGEYTGVGEYFCTFAQITPMGNIEMTIIIELDMEAMILSSATLGPGLSMSFDEKGNLYCNHQYETWEKEPTCTESGEIKVHCPNCGEGHTTFKEALGHDFVDGQCKRCGEKEGYDNAFDEDFLRYREELANQMWNMWENDLRFNYDVSKYEMPYADMHNRLKIASSYEEAENIMCEFEALVNLIREHGSEEKDRIYDGTPNFEYPVLAVGADTKAYLEQYVYGKTVTLHFSLSGDVEIIITPDMVNLVGDTSVMGEIQLEIYCQANNMAYTVYCSVPVEPNFNDAELLGSYTLSYESGMGFRFSLYDNKFAIIEMMEGETVGGRMYTTYTLDGTTLCVEMDGVEMYLTVSEDGTAVNYTPENTTVIGTYTRGESDVYTVYGEYTGAGEYFCSYRELFENGDVAMDMTIVVYLDMEAMTLTSVTLPYDGTMSFDESGALLCNHEYKIFGKGPSCTEGGEINQHCIRCGEKSTTFKEALGHEYAGGQCIRCGVNEDGTFGGGAENGGALTPPCAHVFDEKNICRLCGIMGKTVSDIA